MEETDEPVKARPSPISHGEDGTADAPLPAVHPSHVDTSVGLKREAVVAAMRHSWAGCGVAQGPAELAHSRAWGVPAAEHWAQGWLSVRLLGVPRRRCVPRTRVAQPACQWYQ